MDTPREQAAVCGFCGHPFHHEDQCEEITGYDHMNGDHECGCPGTPPGRDELAYLVEGVDYRQDTPHEIADRVIAGGWAEARVVLSRLADEFEADIFGDFQDAEMIRRWRDEHYPEKETGDVF